MVGHPLSGFYAAILTGFADDGAFDEARQRRVCAHVLGQDIDGLYVSGTTAEQALMRIAERERQIRVVAECVADAGARAIAHVGAVSQRDALHLARVAADAGYAAVSSLPPGDEFVDGFTAVRDYYAAIIQAAGKPMFVYLYPSRARRAFTFEDAAALLSLEGVAGIKFTSEDLYLFNRLRRAFPAAALLYGKDEAYASAALIGADGGIGSTYNLVGGIYRRIHQRVLAGDVAEARRLQALSVDLVVLLLEANLLPATKRALARRGIDCGPCRLPLALGPAEAVARLDRFLESGVLDDFLIANAD